MAKRRFNDKTVVITGASAGIGLQCARRFASEGANIVMVARGVAALETVRKELARLGPVLVIACDIAAPEAPAKIIALTKAEFGGMHILVNNAGCHTRGPLQDQDPDALGKMVDVNLRAPIVLTRHALPLIIASGGGAVVHVASLAGMVPTPGGATYSATKFGLRAFSHALNQELIGRNSNVTSSVVSPGPVKTQFILGELDTVSDLTMSQPMCTADDVAELVVECAWDGKAERTTPKMSAALATMAYVAPAISRALRPILERRGRANKAKLRAKAEH